MTLLHGYLICPVRQSDLAAAELKCQQGFKFQKKQLICVYPLPFIIITASAHVVLGSPLTLFLRFRLSSSTTFKMRIAEMISFLHESAESCPILRLKLKIC